MYRVTSRYHCHHTKHHYNCRDYIWRHLWWDYGTGMRKVFFIFLPKNIKKVFFLSFSCYLIYVRASNSRKFWSLIMFCQVMGLMWPLSMVYWCTNTWIRNFKKKFGHSAFRLFAPWLAHLKCIFGFSGFCFANNFFKYKHRIRFLVKFTELCDIMFYSLDYTTLPIEDSVSVHCAQFIKCINLSGVCI